MPVLPTAGQFYYALDNNLLGMIDGPGGGVAHFAARTIRAEHNSELPCKPPLPATAFRIGVSSQLLTAHRSPLRIGGRRQNWGHNNVFLHGVIAIGSLYSFIFLPGAIPRLPRSNLYRCWQRHGLTGDQSARATTMSTGVIWRNKDEDDDFDELTDDGEEDVAGEDGW